MTLGRYLFLLIACAAPGCFYEKIKFYNLFVIQTVVQDKEKLYNICSCSGSLVGAFCACEELLPGRAVRLAPVRA